MEMFEYMMEGEIYYNLQPTVYFYTVQKYNRNHEKHDNNLKKRISNDGYKIIATGKTRSHGLQVCVLTYELL